MPSAKQFCMTVYLTMTAKGVKLHRLSRLTKYMYLYLINVLHSPDPPVHY